MGLWADARRTRVGALAIVIAVAVAAGALDASAGRLTSDDEPLDPRVERILERVDRAEASLRSLRAEVRETRHLSLLAEPEVFQGVLWFERPEKLRWDYVAPSKRSYVLAEGQMIGWLPESNRLEVVDLSSRQRRLRRLVAIGQDSESLRQEFDLSAPAASSVAGTSELVLVPKSRRLRKRLAELRLWIDHESGLPRQLRYRTGEGDEVLLQLSEMEINGHVPEGTFELEAPEGAKVVQGLSDFGFAGLGSSDSDGEL